MMNNQGIRLEGYDIILQYVYSILNIIESKGSNSFFMTAVLMCKAGSNT